MIEFIQKAKPVIERHSNTILTMSGGTITMVRNQWSSEYKEQMLTLFRDEAFLKLEPRINEIILLSKRDGTKKDTETANGQTQ